jgi:hypothetical protein
MGAIQTASQKITEIIAVIDGIAFQINILVLNAAVEAARAGEQGRASPWWRLRFADWPSAARAGGQGNQSADRPPRYTASRLRRVAV